MPTSLSINGICEKCKGYKFAPYNSNMSATVKLCHCPKKDYVFIEVPKKTLDKVFFSDPPGPRPSSHKIEKDEM